MKIVRDSQKSKSSRQNSHTKETKGDIRLSAKFSNLKKFHAIRKSDSIPFTLLTAHKFRKSLTKLFYAKIFERRICEAQTQIDHVADTSYGILLNWQARPSLFSAKRLDNCDEKWDWVMLWTLWAFVCKSRNHAEGSATWKLACAAEIPYHPKKGILKIILSVAKFIENTNYRQISQVTKEFLVKWKCSRREKQVTQGFVGSGVSRKHSCSCFKLLQAWLRN